MSTRDVLDVIEAALDSDWDVDPQSFSGLPPELRDPIVVFQRGLDLLESGLKLPAGQPVAADYDEQYRAAARNGKPIPDAVWVRMHAARDRAESLKDADESK
jgi:hypothetical protein